MKDWSDILTALEGFEWDEGNVRKNWGKHHVSHIECEEIFFNSPIIVRRDRSHSIGEDRYFVLGRTDSGRFLFVVFTVRGPKIRVISAGDMNRKERRIYEQAEEDTKV